MTNSANNGPRIPITNRELDAWQRGLDPSTRRVTLAIVIVALVACCVVAVVATWGRG